MIEQKYRILNIKNIIQYIIFITAFKIFIDFTVFNATENKYVILGLTQFN